MLLSRILYKTLGIFYIIFSVLALPTAVQGQSSTTIGRDFWVAFIVNGGDQRPQQTNLYAICENSCSMTITNPLTGWSDNISLNSGSANIISIPTTQSVPEHYSTNEAKGFHVTATDDIQLSAIFTQLASSGVTCIFPTTALDTRYIVLDYPADPNRANNTGATVTILATQDSTTINYTPPCSLYTLPGDLPLPYSKAIRLRVYPTIPPAATCCMTKQSPLGSGTRGMLWCPLMAVLSETGCVWWPTAPVPLP